MRMPTGSSEGRRVRQVGIRVSFVQRGLSRESSNNCFFQGSGAHTEHAEVSRPPVWSRRRLALTDVGALRCRNAVKVGRQLRCEARQDGRGRGRIDGNRRQAAGGLSKTRTWQRCNVAVGSAVASTVTNMRRHGEGRLNFDGLPPLAGRSRRLASGPPGGLPTPSPCSSPALWPVHFALLLLLCLLIS